MGMRIVVAVASAALTIVDLGAPAKAAETHSVTITCPPAPGGDSVGASVNAAVGDVVTVAQTGCGWFSVDITRVVPSGTGFSASAGGGYDTSSGTTVSFTILQPLKLGDHIATFAPPLAPGGGAQSTLVVMDDGSGSIDSTSTSPRPPARPISPFTGTKAEVCSQARGPDVYVNGRPDYIFSYSPVRPPKIVGTPTVGRVVEWDPGFWKPRWAGAGSKWYVVNPDGSLKLVSRSGRFRMVQKYRGLQLIGQIQAISQPNGPGTAIYDGIACTAPKRIR